MQKYGFREGQGLGKHEQGLSTALSVEKTSKRGGKIIVGDATEKGAPPAGPAGRPAPESLALTRPCSAWAPGSLRVAAQTVEDRWQDGKGGRLRT